MVQYHFSQLVDLKQVQQLLESHYRLSGMAYGITDTDENLLVTVGFQDICTHFHRTHPDASRCCLESNASIKEQLPGFDKDFIEYRCGLGMLDIAIPVVFDGQHLATFFSGQFFYEDENPDMDFFRNQARKFGFDQDAYLKALSQVPVFSRDHVRSNMLFLRDMVNILVESGLRNLRLSRETTERRQAQERSVLLGFALDHVQEAAFLIDEHARFLYVNQAAVRLLGYDRDELLSFTVPDVDADVSKAGWPGHWRNLVAQRSHISESRQRTKDGRIFPGEISTSYFEFGGSPFVLCLIRDITQRKRLEEKITTSRDFFENIFNTIADPVFVKDDSYRYVLINNAACSMAGLSKEAFLGKTDDDVFAEQSADQHRQADAAVLAGGERSVIEESLTHPNGQTHTILTHKSRYTDPKGSRFIVGSVRDVTELKRNVAINESRMHIIQFSPTHSLDELLEETLNEAEKLTGSRVGFFHFVDEDQTSLRFQGFSTETKNTFCKAEGKSMHYPIGKAGVWADCVHRRKPLIHNDFARLPHRKGFPEGHPEIVRELVVPVLRDDKIKAILGVGNKPADYTKKDVETVSLIADLSLEIVERKTADAAIKRLNRELKAINSCHQVIMRATDEKTLLDEICRIICGAGGYAGVWIGYPENDVAKSIRPISWVGFKDRFIEFLQCSWSEEAGRGPAGIAVRTGDVVCLQDHATDLRVAHLRGVDCMEGLRSSIALPLKDKNNAVLGLINIFASMPDAFSPDDIQLLKTLSDDLAFGIQVLRDQTEHREADRKLRESEARWRLTLEAVQIGVWDWDVTNDTWVASPTYFTMLGYEPESDPFDRDAWLDRVHPEDRKNLDGMIQDVLSGAPEQYRYEARIRHADGTYRWQQVLGSGIEHGPNGKVSRMLGIRMDIDERKQAEEERLETERKFRALVDNIPDCIIRFDGESRIVFVNPAVERTFNIPAHTWLGKSLMDVANPDEVPKYRKLDKMIRQAFNGSDPNRSEGKWRVGGGEKWFDIMHIPEKDDTGKVVSILGIARDITKMKETDQALKDRVRFLGSLEKIHRAIQSSGDFDRLMDVLLGVVLEIFACDRAFLVHPCDPESDYWQVPMEYTRPEYPGARSRGRIPMSKKVADCHQEILAAAGPVIYGSLSKGPPREDSGDPMGVKASLIMAISPKVGGPWLFGLHQCSGRREWKEEEVRLLKEIGMQFEGALTGFLMYRDLKESEERLRESERRMTSFIANVPGFIYCFRHRPDGVFCFPYASPGLETHYGLKPEDIREDMAPLHMMTHPEDRPYVEAAIAESERDLTAFQFEFRMCRPGMPERWIESRSIPEREADGGTLWYGIMLDITERKKLEKALFQARRLEIIGQLAGGVAHEVRNPLNAILSISEAFFREEEIAKNQEYRPYIEHIRTQVTRLSKLMTDLLELGKPIRPANIKPVSLEWVCAEAIQFWNQTDAARNHFLTFNCDVEPGGAMVYTDGERLQQVIFNLIDNAGHCSPEGSDIKIDIAKLGDGKISLRVEDAGRGIAPGKIDRIFEPFFSMRKGGTGLGLTLVKHFVENMGGEITIRNNNPPPGCTAEVILNPAENGEKAYEIENSSHRGQ